MHIRHANLRGREKKRAKYISINIERSIEEPQTGVFNKDSRETRGQTGPKAITEFSPTLRH